MTEYAPGGLFGLLTPQANTTVEAEFRVLCPPRMLPLTARMTSSRPTMEARLLEYVETLEEIVERFANAPLGAVALACTGMSYLVNPDAEREALDGIETRRGYPVITGADAVRDALAALKARRIGIVSPYGDPLHAEAIRYWSGRDLEIVRVERLTGAAGAFHPIYGLTGEAARIGLDALGSEGLDAVVILGTGLPTLDTLVAARLGPVPVLTVNLALMWRVACVLNGDDPTSDTLSRWIDGRAWAERWTDG